MENIKKLAIVSGATGKTGIYIVQELLKKGYLVRIITRNHDSAKKTLGPLFDKIETPIVCDLVKESIAQEDKIEQNTVEGTILEFAFQKGPQGQKPSLFVCAHARNVNTKELCKYTDYLSAKLMIDLCKKNDVNRFVLVSSLSITKPYAFVSILLNTIVGDVFFWKQKTENYIRRSCLDYIICRPGRLVGDQSKSEQTNYIMGQGDVVRGTIQRETVAASLVDVIVEQENKNNNLPKKLTYEVVSSPEKMQEKYVPFNEQKIVLKADTEDNILTGNHIKAKNNVHRLFWSGVVLAVAIPAYFIFF